MNEKVKVIEGDCLESLRDMPAGSVDCVVTDPPYGLEFMGKEWDSFGLAPTGGANFSKDGMGKGFKALPSFTGSPNPTCRKCHGTQRGNDRKVFMRCRCESPDFPNSRLKQMAAFQEWCADWATALLPAVKPGGYLLVFGGTRTYHRLACAVEDAGWEIRDCLMWIYGSGFPKGQGCLKPAWEPVLLARRPGPRVLPLGIDECRVATRDDTGRYPANVLHDGSDEVLAAFAAFGEDKGDGCGKPRNRKVKEDRSQYRIGGAHFNDTASYTDKGSASRFFYCAKASRKERGANNNHPTVKPLKLMRWLVRLVCPPGGTVLDPFAGSGTTSIAAIAEGRKAILIEREPAYCEIIRNRLVLFMVHQPTNGTVKKKKTGLLW